MTACGLDFGTSNTTLGVQDADGFRLLALDGTRTTLPTAVFFDFEHDRTTIGQAAIDGYVSGVEGRLMRSIKSMLGTDLIDADTALRKGRISFRAVIGTFLDLVKKRAEDALGGELGDVVVGRPVHFVDGDPAGDAAAEETLGQIARAAGFRNVSFQFEPIAAALDYEQQVAGEELALIADIGGGTSDFSVVRIGPARRGKADRAGDILANDGIRVGGTDFDRDLSLATAMPELGLGSAMKRAGLLAPKSIYFDLATWSKINFLYTAKAMAELERLQRDSAEPEKIERLIGVVEHRQGHALAMAVERTKIALSDHEATELALDWGDGDLALAVDRGALNRATGSLAARIGTRIRDCLADAGVTADRIDAVFLTGGSTLLPQVRAAILAEAPDARVVEGNIFGSVGLGLTVEALRRYG
ncbi:putative chaperone protein [Azospirillum lipoferum]|uniref:Hsp70 family protein n=1 Tax=Azospirillum lipoferum TaxID=193 RepID=A0A5A9GGM9_AZOLI|nr:MULTISPECIES: Hsp70 family protein [Azospirillum]KAA0593523.1 Hsp70 family protein [Azospirillum lipoferum]MCP1609013.1 putative chaperone protein [Azospirillum lipoferum]MDW5535674.1 Hsp70 family protein [Azospirillum sp. NL1]